MKKLLKDFWRKSLALIKLGIIVNTEFRFNFLVDVLLQPMIAVFIEWILWFAVFQSASTQTIVGYDLNNYFIYALWVTFFARICTNWMYEFRMIEDINAGTLNVYLSRPLSFFEYYWNQYFGYKFLSLVISVLFPCVVQYFFLGSLGLWRVFLSSILIILYLFFTYILSFIVVSFAMSFNRIHSFTVAKNFILMIIVGEYFPLDMLPSPWKEILIDSPFSSGGFLPAGFIAGRVNLDQMIHGFLSTSIGILIFGLIAKIVWSFQMKQYTGTGA